MAFSPILLQQGFSSIHTQPFTPNTGTGEQGTLSVFRRPLTMKEKREKMGQMVGVNGDNSPPVIPSPLHDTVVISLIKFTDKEGALKYANSPDVQNSIFEKWCPSEIGTAQLEEVKPLMFKGPPGGISIKQGLPNAVASCSMGSVVVCREDGWLVHCLVTFSAIEMDDDAVNFSLLVANDVNLCCTFCKRYEDGNDVLLKGCEKCSAPYCSVDCQAKDWKEHKLKCLKYL